MPLRKKEEIVTNELNTNTVFCSTEDDSLVIEILIQNINTTNIGVRVILHFLLTPSCVKAILLLSKLNFCNSVHFESLNL